MGDQLEAGIDSLINAVDMEPGKLYLNATGKIKIKLHSKEDGVVWVQAYSDLHQEWRKTKVDETYKVKIPTKGEIKMAETVEKETKEKVAKVKAEPKNLGKVRGLRMLRTWGQVYKEVGEQGLDAVKAAMLLEFPDKAESIERWAAAYRIYYNTGRLPGVEKPEAPIVWITKEREEKLAEKAAKAQARLDEKNAKKQLKEEEKAAKKAAREEKRAQAAADKQAAEAGPIGTEAAPQ